jgi:thioredoxin-related protein
MKRKTGRKKLLLMLLAFTGCAGSLFAQHDSITFRNLTFEQALAEAGKTGKIVFVDVTGSRTPPMNAKVQQGIFTIDSIADFFNRHCISVHVDMSTDEGKKFAPRLAMLMYPVYVFHDRTGDQLSFLNAGQILKDTAMLMAKARASLATARQKEENTRHIQFETDGWEAALAKAKSENKLVFLDAYTEWCRPCIQMAKDVFTLDKVADFYNGHFINMSMDMEKGEGPALNKKYKIAAYPAFLFVDGNGKVVYQNGGYQEAKEFIGVGETAVKAQQKKK